MDMEEQKVKEKPDSGLSSILLVARYYGVPADETEGKIMLSESRTAGRHKASGCHPAAEF